MLDPAYPMYYGGLDGLFLGSIAGVAYNLFLQWRIVDEASTPFLYLLGDGPMLRWGGESGVRWYLIARGKNLMGVMGDLPHSRYICIILRWASASMNER